EMDFYLWLAPVDIAVITGFGLAHTEFLKDLKTIKSEKLKITKYAKHVVNFSSHKPGPKNALSIARQVAKILEIKPDLSSFTPPPHRLQIINHPSGAIIIDDSYNANPTATKFAVDYLVDLAKKKNQTPVFVFAQMNELGSYEKSAHAAIDKYVAQKGIKNFLTLGPATANLGQHFKSRETPAPSPVFPSLIWLYSRPTPSHLARLFAPVSPQRAPSLKLPFSSVNFP
ncbi:MAG: UDP-N-acetylmuramoyl-tripeptide-D-alanyl-D-alanine ligase, partial [Candidatus Amesbacteria bacterium GW2011_GWA2_47_70]